MSRDPQFNTLIIALEKRGGMYINPFDFNGLVAYIQGYHHGKSDTGLESGFEGFQEWIQLKMGQRCSSHWSALIKDYFSEKHKSKCIPVFFELLHEFIKKKEESGLGQIIKEYEAMCAKTSNSP